MSAPSSRQNAAFSALPTVQATCAPKALPSWIAIVPIPLRATVDEQLLTVLELAHHEHVRPHRAGDLHQCGRLDEGDAERHGGHLAGRHRDVLGIAAAAEQRADLLAGMQIGDAFADGGDLAGALQAENVTGTGRRVVEAPALHQVRAIEPGRDHPDQHLAGPGLGLGQVDDLEGFDPAGVLDDDGTHARTVPIAADVGRRTTAQEAPEKMAGMRVALVQLASATDATANRGAITARLAELTAGDGIDLVVLPEAAMADFGPKGSDLGAVAEPLDGPFVQLLGTEAQRLRATIVAGMFESTDTGLPFNTLAVVGPDGALQATYRKIHLFDSFGHRESDQLSPGAVEPVIVEIAGRSVGLMTCYDLRFPEHGAGARRRRRRPPRRTRRLGGRRAQDPPVAHPPAGPGRREHRARDRRRSVRCGLLRSLDGGRPVGRGHRRGGRGARSPSWSSSTPRT